jgi:hypothetical protein
MRHYEGVMTSKRNDIAEKGHLHHPLLRAFWTSSFSWLIELSVLLCLHQGKALFEGVHPSSSGITAEAVKTAVIFHNVAMCAQAALKRERDFLIRNL